MDGEGAVGIGCFRNQFRQSAFPVVDGIVVGNVPGIIGHSVQSQLGGFSVLHRVAHDTAGFISRETGVQSVHRTLKQEVADVVGYRIVPPVISRTLDAGVDEVECFGCQVAAHHVARPEHLDFRIKRFSVDGQTTFLGRVRPKFGVIGRADRKRRNIAFHLHKLFCQSVEQFCLLQRVGTLAGNIVKEDGKMTHP